MLTAVECLQVIQQAVAEKKAVLTAPISVCFVVPDEGAFTLHTTPTVRLDATLSEDADLMVMCNAPTLIDLLRGQFDVRDPEDGHMWLWAGEDAAWAALDQALSGAQSWLDARISAVSKARATPKRRQS